MFCPVCLYEYKEGIKICPDCGATLVDKLPEEEEGNPALETAELIDVNNEAEAEYIRSVLVDNGIYSFFRSNVLPGSRLAFLSERQKGIGTIIINKEDLEKAKQILKDLDVK
ncbi:MAG: DUF2007 domain-containing protein [Candidatus Goldbacteria bacterium]|nr:DUF2007 domain-containing protein [Candidatus Goldiibacteriota bacterium]